jgi:NitT/TauT family transport system permease protein
MIGTGFRVGGRLSPDERRHRLLVQAASVVALVLAWYLANLASPAIFPRPGLILAALVEQVRTGGLLLATAAALQAILLGYALAIVVGIPIGLAMGLDRLVEELLDPYLYALYVTPFAALIPALVIWFGTGFTIRVVVVFAFALFPIAINTQQGAKDAPPDLLDAIRSFGADRWFLMRHVVVPHEVPYIAAGLRIGIGRAVKGLVVTELLVSVTGLGAILTQWSSAFRLEGVFSVVLVLMAIGITLSWVLRQVEHRFVHWETR